MSGPRLPVIGSTAGTTDFVSVEIQLTNDGRTLHLDGNQKISGWRPKPNALSLRAQAVTDARQFRGAEVAEDCPGSTETCRASCYVGPLEKHQAAIYALYEHNSRTLREILKIGGGYMIDWADMLAAHIRTACGDVGFRWHVSGDVFSAKHARWIAEVCRESPGVAHWIYTRSLEFVPDLLCVSTTRGGNLAINLSADRDNFTRMLKVARDYGLRICYMATKGSHDDEAIATMRDEDDAKGIAALRDGDVIFPDYPLRPKSLQRPEDHPWWAARTPGERAKVCPVDAFGKSEVHRCGVCTKCLT